MSNRIHPTAIVERDVVLGRGTSIWDNVHVRHSTTIGEDCIIGGKSYLAYGLTIGNRVKVNSNVYICNGVTIEDGVMISAGVIFTNDRYPRAATNDLSALRSSDPDEHTLLTVVKEGTTIGAGAIIGCNLTLGRFSMVGMGSVVTKPVADFHLVIGNPAVSIGAVCRCGQPIARWSDLSADVAHEVSCGACSHSFRIHGQTVEEVTSDNAVSR